MTLLCLKHYISYFSLYLFTVFEERSIFPAFTESKLCHDADIWKEGEPGQLPVGDFPAAGILPHHPFSGPHHRDILLVWNNLYP